MQWVQGYPFYLLMGAALGFFLTALSFPYRKTPGRRYFWILCLLGSLLVLTTVFELMSASFAAKLWWRNVQQAPLFFCGLFAYALVMDYVGKANNKLRKQLLALSIPIVIYLLLIATDSFHHWMRSEIGLDTMGELGEVRIKPTLLSMVLIVFNQLLCLFAVFILAVQLRNTPSYYFKRHVLLLAGLLLPVAFIFLLPMIQIPLLGATAVAFIPSGLLLYYALFRYELLSVWPVAKDKIFLNMKDGIILADHEDTIVDMNPAAGRMVAAMARQGPAPGVGNSVRLLLQRFPELAAAYEQRAETTVEAGGIEEAESCYSTALIPIGLHEAEQKGMLLILSDISDKKRYERELILQATIDELTGVSNRRHFLSRVREQLGQGAQPAALLLVDIDDFKLINDTYGHAAGDKVLLEFAHILKATFAHIGIVGRIGGEEFAVLAGGLSDKQVREAAEAFLQQLEAHQVKVQSSVLISITASVGGAYAHSGGEFEDLYQSADEALYRSKAAGKNRVTFGMR